MVVQQVNHPGTWTWHEGGCRRCGDYGDQLELLKEMECDNIQGFYYSRPLPKAEFVKKSEEN